MADRTKIFIAYCFPEKRWRDRLQAVLEPMVGAERCVIWDETKLRLSPTWKAELPDVLATTKVAMMIVSDMFLESEFISRAKLPALLERERKSGLEICWVLASHCLFELAGIKEADAGNHMNAALDGLGAAKRDAELADVARKVASYLGVALAPEQVAVAEPTTTRAPVVATAGIPLSPTPKQVPKKRRPQPLGKLQQEAALWTIPPPPEPAPAPAAAPPLSPAPKGGEPRAAAAPVPAAPPPAAAAEPAPSRLAPVPAGPPLAPAPAPTPPVPEEVVAPVVAAPAAIQAVPITSDPLLIQSLDIAITTRQRTVRMLNFIVRALVFLAVAIAIASVPVAMSHGAIHLMLIAGFALVVASLALRLRGRSRFLGQCLVTMRYTRGALADESLPGRQREPLMRKAAEILGPI